MKALDRKLLRDLRLMWSQALTIALVVASSVAGFITTFSAYDALSWSRDLYYADARFADVFATLKRAPLSLERLNKVHLRSGRMIEAHHSGAIEALVSEGFAIGRQLKPGDRIGALINGRREELLIVGIALSPEYIFAGMAGSPD